MWLVGMMGSGKTSVGKLVARALAVPFYDTDEAVAATHGASIAALWDERGEEHFRDLERAAIAEAPPGVVAAAGGGAVLDTSNSHIMRLDPPVVWLRARVETLAERLESAKGRPLLTGPRPPLDVLRELVAAREPSYEAAATHIVDTDNRSLEDVATEVSELWPG